MIRTSTESSHYVGELTSPIRKIDAGACNRVHGNSNSLDGWLICLGQWRIILIGIGSFLGASTFIGIALTPGLILLPFAKAFKSKSRILTFLVLGLPQAYTTIVTVAWCAAVLHYTRLLATTTSPLPIWLWGYKIATGPWAYMSSYDQRTDPKSNPFSMFYFFQSLMPSQPFRHG